MRGQGGARGFAIARDDVHDSVGNSCFLNQFAQAQAGQRRLLRRLDHYAASRSQRRAQLPGRHQQGEIPRNDLADHAHRLAQGVSQELGAGGNRNGVAFNLGRPARHVAEQVHGQRHVRHPRDFQRLAVVEHFQFGKFLQVLLQQIAQLPDQASALGGRHLRPGTGFERGASRLDGAVDVFAISLGYASQDLARGRVVGGECLAGGGFHPLSVNQHLAVLGDVTCDLVVHLNAG